MPTLRANRRIVAAISVGVILGVAAWAATGKDRSPKLAFLKKAIPLATLDRSELERSFIYSVPLEWKDACEAAKRELPNAIERREDRGGSPATFLTIPQTEDGRVKITAAPKRQVLLIPGKAMRARDGQVVQSEADPESWTTVEIREYEQPGLLHTLRAFIRRSLNV